jgi:hypothetical protein
MTVLITLTTAGASTGPFDLYSDVDGYLVPFETLVPKASLVSGYTSTLVPNGTTIVRVKSNSVCINFIDITISLVTTTTTTSSSTSTSTSTSTTTSSTTLTPCRCYTVSNPTEVSLNVTYTPCNSEETVVGVSGGGTVSLCVEPFTIIFREDGLSFPVECSETCSEIITCTTCTP